MTDPRMTPANDARATGIERVKQRRAARDASGQVYVDGSIYEGMAACLVRSGKTIAHVVEYGEAVAIAAALASAPAAVDARTLALVIAAREFWDIHNDLSDESRALDKALEPFSATVPYENEPASAPAGDAVVVPSTPTKEMLEASAVEWTGLCHGYPPEPGHYNFMTALWKAMLGAAPTAVVPAGDGVEDEYTYDELWQAIADATRIEGGVIAISVRTFRESIRATDSAAALARPRAAVGEREAEALARAAADGCDDEYPEGRRQRGTMKWGCAYDGAMRAILALQSPPAKVEG